MDPGEKRRLDDGLQLGEEFVPARVEHGSVEAPIGLSEVLGITDRPFHRRERDLHPADVGVASTLGRIARGGWFNREAELCK